jgi:hypothetical protein
MGTLYLQGRGVTKDYSQAASWYRKAADKKDASSEEHTRRPLSRRSWDSRRTTHRRAPGSRKQRIKAAHAPRCCSPISIRSRPSRPLPPSRQPRLKSERTPVRRKSTSSKLRDHAEKVADLRQRVEEADSEAEQAENQAQEAKASAEQAANSGGGVFGTLAIALNGGVQFKAEQNAQKKRAEADQLRAQLTELGEEVIQPPPLPNSIEEDAGRDRISEARDRGIANINAAAAQNAAIKAQQAAVTAQQQGQSNGNSAYDKCEAANYAQMMAAPSDPHAASKATNNDPCDKYAH